MWQQVVDKKAQEEAAQRAKKAQEEARARDEKYGLTQSTHSADTQHGHTQGGNAQRGHTLRKYM
jgi:hypothetical protein